MKFTIPLLLALCSVVSAVAQKEIKTIDKVVGVVGEEIILLSEIESQLVQMKQQSMPITDETPCRAMEELLYQNLLIHRARIDSVIIGESQIDADLERRIQVFIQQFGSKEKMERYYNKSIDEIKFEFRDLIEEQLMAQQIQQGITASAAVTPADVRAFYNAFPKDSLPYMNSELELSQILRKPPVSEAEDERIRKEVEEYRRRIVEDGDDFGFLAATYSEDPGSAVQRGELGFMSRGQLVPEFARVAFSLQPGQLSPVVKTEYGYHIMELIKREGEMANIRHLLRVPKISTEDLVREQEFLMKVRDSIMTIDSLTMEEMAFRHTHDDESRYNGGKMVNPQTGTNQFDSELLGQMDRELFFMTQKLDLGAISEPIVAEMPDGTRGLRIVQVKKRTEPHVANLKDDYQKIAEVALVQNQNTAVTAWINKYIPSTYLRIESEYESCKFDHQWLRVPEPTDPMKP